MKCRFFFSLFYCISILYKNDIIAYPTESIFGLGCNPDSKNAVFKLLKLKNRNIKKGFILVASNYNQLIPYICENKLSFLQKKIFFLNCFKCITFLVPANPNIPRWITGGSNFVAVRITKHYALKKICEVFNKPIISTSANISGMKAARSKLEIYEHFGHDFPILFGDLGNYLNPSKIFNIVNGEIIRNG